MSSLIQTNGQVSLTLTCAGNDSFGIEGFFQSGVNPNSGVYIDDICVLLVIPPSQTPTPTVTPTITPTNTVTPTITPTNTVTPTPTQPNLKLSLMSLTSDPVDACPLSLTEIVYIQTTSVGFVGTGDRIFLDNAGTNPFPGDGNYWRIKIQTDPNNGVSATVDINGYIGGLIAICL